MKKFLSKLEVESNLKIGDVIDIICPTKIGQEKKETDHSYTIIGIVEKSNGVKLQLSYTSVRYKFDPESKIWSTLPHSGKHNVSTSRMTNEGLIHNYASGGHSIRVIVKIN